MPTRSSHRFPAVLLALYVILFTALAISPLDRQTWFVENITILFIVGALLVMYAVKIRFSNTAYALMSVLIFLHTIGGHYTFEKVPFEWVTNFFNFERNHFDRIAHFSVGFYAFAIAEMLHEKRLIVSRFLLFTYPIFLIATVAMSYEIIEWIYAANADPLAGAAYLGSQGDIWDAQKDMLADTLGAIIAMVFFLWTKKIKTLKANIATRS